MKRIAAATLANVVVAGLLVVLSCPLGLAICAGAGVAFAVINGGEG